jgi:anthraniloyl-CoA monooxygenase
MRQIACVGSGPASLLFALAVNRNSQTHAVTLFRGDFGVRDSTGFALSDDARRDLPARLAALLGAPLPTRRWRQADVIQCGVRTAIDGDLGAAADRARLADLLESAIAAQERPVRIGDAAVAERELAAFDCVVVEDTDPSTNEARFEFAVTPTAALGLHFEATHLAADRVLEVVARDGSLFLGHGFVVAERKASFYVEAAGGAWSRAGLREADPQALCAFAAEAFSRSLGSAKLALCRGLSPLRTAVPKQWRSGKHILLGGAAKAVHPSFLYRTELALDEALALAAAFGDGGAVEPALERYEKARSSVAASAARASQAEMNWLENLRRYTALPLAQFAFNALTRSLRVNHRDLEKRAPSFVAAVDREFAGTFATANQKPPPPMFVPFTLRGLTLENRVGVSPMCMYQADDGTVNDFHLVHLGSRAVGGAGIVFTEMTNVSPEGRISCGCAGMYKPEHVAAWKRIVDYVHRHSSAKIAIQLAHAGRRASTALPWEGRNVPPPQGGWETLAPSAISFCDTLPAPRAMTHADIARIVADFSRAARWSEEAGFDLVELHFAHGYLLSTFLSPLANKRTDEFGGDLAGRARFPLEVVRAVRAAWPVKPLSVRISAVDWSPGGSTIEEMIEFSAMLKLAGVDIVDVSTGNVVNTRRPTAGRLFQTGFSDQIRNQVKIPTMTVGKIASYGDINAVLAAGRADLCLLAKGHLRHPYFTREAAAAQGHDLPWPKSYRGAEEFSLRDEC